MSELSSGKKFPLREGGARGLLPSPPLKVRANSRPDGAGGWVGLCFAIALLLFSSVALSEAFKLPDTGQTKCYQAVSPYAEISCSGTGQDGAYNTNPRSYTVIGGSNSDMVQDNNTGLIWQRQDDGNYYNWYQATGEVNSSYNPSGGSYKNICGDLNLGGYTDWRLPSKKELVTIVDYSIPDPGPTINPVFTGTQQSVYWSSTTYAYYPDYAWGVNFYSGSVGLGDKDYYGFYVRCVRAGQ